MLKGPKQEFLWHLQASQGPGASLVIYVIHSEGTVCSCQDMIDIDQDIDKAAIKLST